MLIVDVASFSLLGAVFLVMIGFAWRVPRAIQKSADEINARIDVTNAKIDTTAAQLNTKIDTTAVQLNAKIDTTAAQLNTKIDTEAAQLNAKIDTTNAILADLRERVAYLEGRANPPPRAA